MAGKKGKERKLTNAERRRLERFEATCEDLVSQGYRRVNLIISIGHANLVATVALIALLVVCLPVFHLLHPQADLFLQGGESLVAIAIALVLVVVHELIHGLTWSRFAPGGFKDIEFGIMLNVLAPYCTCGAPLRKDGYLLGSLMPLIVLGVIPTIAAFITGSTMLLYLGIFMIDAASGDVMIVREILRHHPTSDDVLLYDHPTEAGSVVFER